MKLSVLIERLIEIDGQMEGIDPEVFINPTQPADFAQVIEGVRKSGAVVEICAADEEDGEYQQ